MMPSIRELRHAKWIIFLLSIILPASCSLELSTSFDFHKSIGACQNKICGIAMQAAKVSESSVNCRCDDKCAEYGDCCYDSPAFNLRKEPQPRYECVDLLIRAVYMKTECPIHLRESKLGKSCKTPSMADPYLSLPVTNSRTLTTYKNSFCAKCHNENDLVYWNFEMYYLEDESDYEEVDSEILMENLLYNSTLNSWGVQKEDNFQKIYLAPSPPKELEPSIRQCKTNVRSGCMKEWHNSLTENLCASYTYLVYDKGSFRNPHCAMCNNVTFDRLSCQDTSQRDSFDFNNIHHLPGIFSIYDKSPSCNNESYDIFAKKCRDFNENKSLSQENHSVCNKVIIKSGNYKLENKSEIIIPIYDAKIPAFEVNITNNGDVLICAEALGVNNEKELNLAEIGQKIVSLVGYTLSIVLLLIHLIVFTAIADKNLSESNIASLSLCLLVAYTALLIGNSFSGMKCYIVSIVTFFSLLASFQWMFTISYDIWRLVRSANKGLKEKRGSQWTKFMIYSLWSWTAPALLVGSAIYIDNSSFMPIHWKPLFGVHNCWFGHQRPLIIFFVIPFIILTILNTIMFSHSAYVIYIIKKSVHSSQHKRKFRMHIKLALTVGLTWATGLIGMVFDNIPVLNNILWYIFTFLNAFQGIFIFINFTCKRKYINKLEELWKNIFEYFQ